MSDDDTLLRDYLYYTGEKYLHLTVKEQDQVRVLGDGFGTTKDLGLIWLWDHIRLSSPRAKQAMVTKIKELTGKAYSDD